MMSSGRVVAVIPARTGSKSVENKNLYPLGGTPLICWPIEVALATPEIDRVIVSTDGKDIAATARKAGAEVSERPAHLAGDTSLVIDTLRYVVAKLREEGETAVYMVLLEPTSPFRASEDISNCLTKLESEALDSVATFMEPELNPNRAWRIENGVPEPYISGADPWQPRQLLPPAWQLNGAVYAFRIASLPSSGAAMLFGRTGAITMPNERSLDIDSLADFKRADAVLEEKTNEDS